jgi:hypothetical protein
MFRRVLLCFCLEFMEQVVTRISPLAVDAVS